MQHSVHHEYMKRTLLAIGDYAYHHIKAGRDLLGWLDYFNQQHPEEFKKYEKIYNEINTLWGKTDGPSLERFKRLLKSFEDAYKWGMNKYAAYLKEEAQKSPQGVLL